MVLIYIQDKCALGLARQNGEDDTLDKIMTKIPVRYQRGEGNLNFMPTHIDN